MNETQLKTPIRTQVRTQVAIDALLDAAASIMGESGIERLTLDAVARKANLSKGGLLHHFPSKKALITGMFNRLLQQFYALVEQHYSTGSTTAGRWLRAYIHATFDPAAPQMGAELAAMITSVVHDDALLLERLREDAQQWDVRLSSDGVPSVRARLIRHACDGYALEQTLQTAQAETSLNQLAELRDELLSLVEIR